MVSQITELVELIRNSLNGRSLGASLKIDFGEHGLILIDGSDVSQGDAGAGAETTLTTSMDVFADICAGLTDAVQASYNGQAIISGSQSTTLRLTELLDTEQGPTSRVGRFSRSVEAETNASSLSSRGAAVIEECVPP
jgi:putative sterol carrier protein